MMQARSKPYVTPEEYLAIERAAPFKSEYIDGEMFAMAGASREHNLIVANLIGSLIPQLRGRPCRVYPSDLRLEVTTTGLYTYPDVIVVCGAESFADANVDTLQNPTLLIEVLSSSTAEYDRGKKSEHYRRLDSLAEYLLVEQDSRHIEQFVRRSPVEWTFTEAFGDEGSLSLPSIGCHLALSDVYDKVDTLPPA